MKNKIKSHFVEIVHKIECVYNDKNYEVKIWADSDDHKWIDWEVCDCNGKLVDDDTAELVIEYIKTVIE